jgi:hypothetical protein
MGKPMDIRSARYFLIKNEFKPIQHQVLWLFPLFNFIRSFFIFIVLLSSFHIHAQDGLYKWQKPHKPITEEQIAESNPFYPSRATTDGRQLTPAMFENPEVCKGCHSEITSNGRSQPWHTLGKTLFIKRYFYARVKQLMVKLIIFVLLATAR